MELRSTFDDTAALYHRARPGYPDDLFRDVFEITRLAPPARLLEVGPGTGIATLVLAERGFEIVGVELAEEMAEAARRNVESWEAVEIVTGSFETFTGEGGFDAVYAFSAFHWIDPSLAYQRAAGLLKEPGFLIVADARYVSPEDGDPFFVEVAEDHEAVLGELAHEPGAPGLRSLRDEMNDSKLFSHIGERRYRWHVAYTANSYTDLLDTLPWYRALPPSERAELYERIRSRIRKRPSGEIRQTLDARLDIARRRPR